MAIIKIHSAHQEDVRGEQDSCSLVLEASAGCRASAKHVRCAPDYAAGRRRLHQPTSRTIL